ncbi:unnamed protein product [Orchesella dallaii]|uniref:Uncharacterized protein n=1 Tax=Orchesella dallaii TaxID=48710 RepID=A0ABP1QC52_9HEXA
MLPFSLLRYWWLRPLIPDPLDVQDHDPLKSKSLSSFLEPYAGPQLSRTQLWSRIPHFIGGIDPMQRSIVEIEKAVAEGKDMILVESEMAGHIYFHYVSHGWLLQENTIFYGLLGLYVAYAHPNAWYLYTPYSIVALMHSYVYFRVYKNDRLSQYQAYDDDRHPVSNLITAWVLGQRPDHYQYVLKKERVIIWEIFSELSLYSSMLCTLIRLWQIEECLVGRSLVPTVQLPKSLTEELYAPAYCSGYFQPIELISVAPGFFLPSHIPNVQGWFDIPWLKIRLKPIKFDLAIIICTLGGYFVFKAVEHFLSGPDHIIDEIGREWSDNDGKQSNTKVVNSYWVENEEDEEAMVFGTKITEQRKMLQSQELQEITRIASLYPYGWKPPGYSENHYGVFT